MFSLRSRCDKNPDHGVSATLYTNFCPLTFSSLNNCNPSNTPFRPSDPTFGECTSNLPSFNNPSTIPVHIFANSKSSGFAGKSVPRIVNASPHDV